MSRASYPPSALYTVTVRATEFQRSAWTAAAKRAGMAGPGPLLAWAADLYVALLDAYLRVSAEHSEQLDPGGRK